MTKRLTQDGLRRLVRAEARRVMEGGPGSMRSQTRARRKLFPGQTDPTAEREDTVDDLSLDPRMASIHAVAEELMAEGHTIDDVIAALIVLVNPGPGR